ncbi:MAG: CarD family transcriptional regulator [Lachnospiraceae bacterium]|nr:CarD family transcriptional regulator [Lachnospiraceae bacterium]
MYQKNDRVICGGKGVCSVEDITTLNMPGIDKEREYYILKPLYMASSTVYIPVDAAQDSLRDVLSKDEAEELIQAIPSIPMITISNDKMLEQEYRLCMKANRCDEWIKVIKTIFMRKRRRLEAGRKVTAVDAKYYKLAEDNLYGELAVALGMPKESVEAYITGEIEKRTEEPAIL